MAENKNKQLVCWSCNYFSLHISACPHVLAAMKCFKMAETVLPFICKNLKATEAQGVDLQTLYAGIPIDEAAAGRLITSNDFFSEEDTKNDCY